MGLVTVAETLETQASRVRVANQRRRFGALYRRVSWLLIILLIFSGFAGFFYLNRDQGIMTLRIASGPYRSDSYELMVEIADVVDRHSENLKIEVVPSKDSSQNISMLNRGSVELATIRSDTPVVSNVRMVADLFSDYFQLITRSESLIYSPTDLIGKKIAIANFGTDEFRSFWIVGDHYDLPINGMKWQTVSFDEASEALLSGEVDAVFTVRSLRDRVLLNLFQDAELKGISLRYISLDQAAAISIKRPFLKVGNLPKGTFSGKAPTPRAHTITPTVQRILVTRDDLEKEPIRELTQILFENRLDLIIRFALASAIKPPRVDEGLAIPLHVGSMQYFDRDKPSFIQEYAEPLTLLVTLAAMLFSGLLALRSRLLSIQKDRMDSYNYVLLDIAEKANNTTEIAEIRKLKGILFETLEKVVRALDADEVTEEGFQTFSFLWESVRVMLVERQKEISN